jgi:hypothetical protein
MTGYATLVQIAPKKGEVMGSKFTELVIDCADPDRMAEFWSAVLDYKMHCTGMTL